MRQRYFLGVAFGTLVICGSAMAQSSTQGSPSTGGLGIWNLGWPPQLVVPPNNPPPQPPPQPTPSPLTATTTTHTEELCKGSGPTWFRVTTTTTTYSAPDAFGPTITQTTETDTGEKCQDKGSTRPDDSPAANPKSKYPVLMWARNPNGAGGTPPPAGSGSSGKGILGPQPIAARAKKAVSASTAFQFVLPWRSLPAPPLYIPSDIPPYTVSCMSQLNPTAFWIDHINGTVTLENMCTSAPLGTLNVTSNPLQVGVTPDGSTAIVTSYDSGITFVDTTSNQIVTTIQTGPSFTPSGLAISPDGSYALVTNYEPAGLGGAALAVVDIAKASIVSMIPLDQDYPQSVFLNPDATLIWVTYPFENAVEVIDVMTGKVVRSLNLDSPCDVVFNPTGTFAYIAGGEASGYVSAFNAQTYATVGTVTAGAGACDLLFTPDEAFLSVNNYLAGSQTFIDVASFQGVTVQTTGSPRGVALLPTQ
jgi:hypothetical protein